MGVKYAFNDSISTNMFCCLVAYFLYEDLVTVNLSVCVHIVTLTVFVFI